MGLTPTLSRFCRQVTVPLGLAQWSANLFPTENPQARQRSNSVEGERKDGISGCARENLELAFFAENRVERRGRGARVHASKVKKHHGFVGGMADMTLVISGARG
jgi:hypothetical protein